MSFKNSKRLSPEHIIFCLTRIRLLALYYVDNWIYLFSHSIGSVSSSFAQKIRFLCFCLIHIFYIEIMKLFDFEEINKNQVENQSLFNINR